MSKQKKAPPRNSRKSSLSAKAKRAKATRLEAKLIRMAEQTEPDPRDPLAAKSLRDFRSAPGFLHKDDKPELLAQIAELGNGKSFVATATNESEERLVTVVRERWAEFEKHEKHFSKELAAALVALHAAESKYGHGTFQAHLKELKIPKWTAYRVMTLHGWTADKSKKKDKKPSPLLRDIAITKAIGYFAQFTGKKLQQEVELFIDELRKEVAAELAKGGGNG